MKILVVPLIVIFLPIAVLFFLLKYWGKSEKISNALKVVLGLTFTIIGFIISFYAASISMDGMSQKGIQCVTGAITFVPLGFLLNIIGIPLLLILFKNRSTEKLETEQ